MKRRILWTGLVVVWCSSLVFGWHFAMGYDTQPGTPGTAPSSFGTRSEKDFSCVMVAHPKCPCTEASLKGLREAAAQHGGQVGFEIVFVGEPIESRNVELAGQVAGASVGWVSSEDAANEYGAYTSGQLYVFDRKGRAVYSGGVTPGRGVDQPTFARDLFRQIIKGTAVDGKVFGCPLQDVEP